MEYELRQVIFAFEIALSGGSSEGKMEKLPPKWLIKQGKSKVSIKFLFSPNRFPLALEILADPPF
jgi:hypothetical protein